MPVRFALLPALFLRAVRAAFFAGLARGRREDKFDARDCADRLVEAFRARRPAAARFGVGFGLRLALLRVAGGAFGFEAALDTAGAAGRFAALAGAGDVIVPAATLVACARVDRSAAARVSDFADRATVGADATTGAAAVALPRAVRAGFATRYGASTETSRAKIVSMSPTPSTSTILFLRW